MQCNKKNYAQKKMHQHRETTNPEEDMCTHGFRYVFQLQTSIHIFTKICIIIFSNFMLSFIYIFKQVMKEDNN